MSAWLRAAEEGKPVHLSVNFQDISGGWLRDLSTLHLADWDKTTWGQVGGEFTIADPRIAHFSIEAWGDGFLDEVAAAAVHIHEVREPFDEATKAELAQDAFYCLTSKAFRIFIGKRSGLVHHLVSLEPVPKVIQPAGRNSMLIYLTCRSDASIRGTFDTLREVRYRQKKGSKELKCQLVSSVPAIAALAEAQVTYLLTDDNFRITV